MSFQSFFSVSFVITELAEELRLLAALILPMVVQAGVMFVDFTASGARVGRRDFCNKIEYEHQRKEINFLVIRMLGNLRLKGA